jgi:hypothetical protein
MTMPRIAAFVMLVVAGCGGGRGSAPPPMTAASTTPSADAGRPSVLYGIEGAPEGVPVVAMSTSGVTVAGTKLSEGDVAAIRKARRSDGLVRALEAWKTAHPTEAATGRVAFEFDRDTTWAVALGTLGTAAHAGYPHVALLTRLPKEGAVFPSHLDLEVRLDKKKSEGRELHLSLSGHGAVMLKWMEAGKQLGDVVSSDAVTTKLAPVLDRGHNERGLHREPGDQQMDQAVLHVEADTAYALVVVALDALHSPKRTLGGKTVPALHAYIVGE